MKPTIIIVISRGEVIRNFVYSGIAQELRNNYSVIFASVIPNEKLREYLVANCDSLYELNELKLSYCQRLLHEIIDLAHNRYLWSEAARVRWNMRDLEANKLFQKVNRSIKKVVATLLSHNETLSILEKFDYWLSSKNRQVKEYQKIITHTRPQLVFNGSHSHSKIAYNFLQASRLEGIKTAAFLFSWDNLTSQGRVFPPHDFYFSWNSAIKNDFHKIYPDYCDSSVMVTGTTQFIGHFNKDLELGLGEMKSILGLKPNEKYFLYSSGMSNHMPYEPYVVSRIADIIQKLGPEYRLVVRTYAKDRQDVFDQLKFERPDIIIPEVNWEKKFQTPLLDDQLFFKALLKNCVAGVNVASTITLELCMFDKPAINVGYNPPGKDISPYDYVRFYNFDHYRPIVESGAIRVAKDELQMAEYLKEAIDNPSILHEYRVRLINKFFDLDPEMEIDEQLGQLPKLKMLKRIKQILEN
jgi:hypothetical protein